jgi:putative phosphoesterase
MNLGIMSDSHGRAEPVRRALTLLDSRGADAIIHCGDVGRLDVLDELAGRRCWFVWGNTDSPRATWRPHVEALGLPWPDGPLELRLAGRRIAVFHGHERELSPAVQAAAYDYLFHGHTHQCDDYRTGGMRVVSPGALHRASVKTVALLNLATDHLEFLDLDGRRC